MPRGSSINGHRKNLSLWYPFENYTSFAIDCKYTFKELINETYYCMVAVGSELKITTGKDKDGYKKTPVREIVMKKYLDLLGIGSGTWNWDLSLKVLNELKVYNTLKDQTKMLTFVDVMLLMSYQNKDHESRKVFNHKFDDMYLVFEKYGTNLDYILRKGPLLELSVHQWLLSELLSAVSSLHSQKLIHRDIRPYNVCVSFEEKILKLKNFGLSCGFSSKVFLDNMDDIGNNDDEDGMVTEFTPIYTAPEVLLGKTTISPAVDVWGVGCTFAEILNGGCPLFLLTRGSKRTSLNKMEEITASLQTKGFLDKISPNPLAIDLLRKMLVFYPDDRISLEEAKQHPFFGCGGSSSRVVALAEEEEKDMGVVEVTEPAIGVVEPDSHALRKLIWKEMETFEMNQKKTLEINKKRNFEKMNNKTSEISEILLSKKKKDI